MKEQHRHDLINSCHCVRSFAIRVKGANLLLKGVRGGWQKISRDQQASFSSVTDDR
jgi:hypothetical protein